MIYDHISYRSRLFGRVVCATFLQLPSMCRSLDVAKVNSFSKPISARWGALGV